MQYPQGCHYNPDPSHLDPVSPGRSPILQGLGDFLPQEAGWVSAGMKILYVEASITCYSFPPPSLPSVQLLLIRFFLLILS